MLEQTAQEIKDNGEFRTYLGSEEEAVYVHKNDVWVIREDSQGDIYSVWNPTNDVLVTRE